MRTDLFVRFAPVLVADPAPLVRDPRLLLDSEGEVAIYYAPFEYINPAARIVLVGITPGPTQMVNANNEARSALLSGRSSSQAMQAAKDMAAFSGSTMRTNLIRQLNHWGFPQWLGLDDAGDLFGKASGMLQSTSLLRYPVFAGGEPYRGAPDMTSRRNALLRAHLLEHFVREVEDCKDALFLALGPCVQRVFDWLAAEKIVDGTRVVRGLFHPSGNCTYRIDYLTGDRRRAVPHATNPVPYDRGRSAFRQTYLAS